MDALKDALQMLMDAMAKPSTIPLGISNRHIHLAERDLEILFGKGYQLTKMKDLSQPGQYACHECITICGPKGAIEKVRILGPVRSETQVEVLRSDCFKLGANAPVRMSGDLTGTPSITLVGPQGSVYLKAGLIVAQRHIHMTLRQANEFEVCDGQIIKIAFDGQRGGCYHNVVIRANDNSGLECHLDMEEANAFDLSSKSTLKIIK